jgi:hypothetical protein
LLEEARAQIDAIGQQKQGHQQPSSAKKGDLLQSVDFLGGMKSTGQHLYNRGHGDLLPQFDTVSAGFPVDPGTGSASPARFAGDERAPGTKLNVPEALAGRLQVTLFFA